MKLEEITPTSLKKVDDQEILSLHRRTHQWFANAKKDGTAIESIVNAHGWIVDEMERRGMDHNAHPGLDQVKLPKPASAQTEFTVISDYVSIVGSVAREGIAAAHDLDLLIREDGEAPVYFRESLMLLLRRFFDPNKTGKELHLLFNPQGPHVGKYVPVFDLVLRVSDGEAKLVKAASLTARTCAAFGINKVSVKPFDKYTAQKPSMKYYTDFVSVKELWDDWASAVVRQEGAVLVSPKVDGLRAMIHMAGDRAMVYSEDTKETYDIPLPKSKTSMIVEGELQAVAGGKYVARTELISLLANNFKGATPTIFLYDVLYWDGQDIHMIPFQERFQRIKDAARVLGPNFVALPQEEAKSEVQLKSVARSLLNYNGPRGRDLPIEGIVTRQPNMPYSFGSTSMYAKTKRTVEVKALVLSVNKVANGFTYDCALREPNAGVPSSRVVEIAGRQYQKLGKTFVSEVQLCKEGDTLNVTVEEIIVLSDGTCTWGKPTPQGPDRSRSAYTVDQVISLARRYGALREEELEPTKKVADEPEGGAGEAAKYWQAHWFETLPHSGQGHFVYQHHWRGLTEDEAKNSGEAALLETDHSLHGDLRLQGTDVLWGWTIFLGKTSNNRAGERLAELPADDNLQCTPKLAQPESWLGVGVGKPDVSEPASVGATSQTWAKFFAYDTGTYRLGVAREHMFEVFLHGSKLKGRFVIMFAPMGGRRVWLIDRAVGSKPYAEEHKLEAVIKELRSKRQKYLVWGDETHGPYFVNLPKDGDALLAALAEKDADQWKVLVGVVKKAKVDPRIASKRRIQKLFRTIFDMELQKTLEALHEDDLHERS